jgi:pimeloyl-ACP methyl ester carboxylesterase
VLVHGALTDACHAWDEVQARLEKAFTVVSMDRRGHGASGDSQAYALDREVEDVLAVLAAAESPAILVGHSFGAVCALEAARHAPGLRALVLYEGGPCDGRVIVPAGAADQIADDLRRGDRDGALSDMLLRVVHLSPRQVAHARGEATWAEHLANVDTVARELGARRGLMIDARELHDIHTPVLLLVGSRSPPAIKEATAALARGLPHARVVTLEGQGHSAMHSSPALFAATLLEFTAAIEPPPNRLSVQPEGASAASSSRASSSAAAESAPGAATRSSKLRSRNSSVRPTSR